MITECRPAALLTLSGQQDWSRCLKLNKCLKTDIIDFLMHYEFVRADDRVPRSLCHVITNFSSINRRSGKATDPVLAGELSEANYLYHPSKG
jgi:hypothetical protein